MTRKAAHPQGYHPRYADQQAHARRWQGSKLDRDSSLRAAVLAGRQRGWSPQQGAGRLARDHHRPIISSETIYRFIYAQIARHQDYTWRHYLPQAKSKRGRRRAKGRSAAAFIAQRRPLAERPAEAADRRTPGHWEAISCCSGPTATPSLPSMNATPACSWPPGLLASRPHRHGLGRLVGSFAPHMAANRHLR